MLVVTVEKNGKVGFTCPDGTKFYVQLVDSRPGGKARIGVQASRSVVVMREVHLAEGFIAEVDELCAAEMAEGPQTPAE